jgi:hypothetical protein
MHHATREKHMQTIWHPLPHMPIILLKYYVMYEFNTEVPTLFGGNKTTKR